MIVDQGKIALYCDREYDSALELLHKSVEGWIKASTRHDWEYDSDGYVEFCTRQSREHLQLEHYPVYQITEISPITSGIKIRNTSADSRNAYVSVDSDSLDLTVVGGDNAMTASEAFSTYTTLSTLIAQINTEGKGWDAVVYDTDYNSYLSPSLLEVKNFFCGSVRGATPSYKYLEMLDAPYDEYTVNEESGIVTRSGGWAGGYRRIVAKYTAYYTIPDEITGAVLNGVKFMATQYDEDTEGVSSFSTQDLSTKFESIMPGYVLDVVQRHSKVM